MKFSALPPVRREVPVIPASGAYRDSFKTFFHDREVTLYASGTSALAHAIAACAATAAVRDPEVIIPAYGCPDLVSACDHASVKCRLVDVGPSQWTYDSEALARSISSRTVAIIAVNLLGVGDSSVPLAQLCRERKISLIQDSAQYLPREPIDWPGDFVVLSFGRGKPLNLLHGGALIAKSPHPESGDASSSLYPIRNRLLATRIAATAFNALTQPFPYWVISHFPATRLGNVLYKPLSDSAPLPERAWTKIASAFTQYCARPSYQRELWLPVLDEWRTLGITELLDPSGHRTTEPLRLAMLAPNRSARDTIVSALHAEGLGVSRLYGDELTRLACVPAFIKKQGPFPKAQQLAGRLFTLPTHNLVTQHVVNMTHSIIKASCTRAVGP